MLPIYKILQPPKFGNCQVKKTKTPVLTFGDIDAIFDLKKKTSASQIKIDEIKIKLNAVIQDENDERDIVADIPNDLYYDHDYYKAMISDCIVYYLSGFLCRKMKKKVLCLDCKKVFEDSACINARPQAKLVDIKSRGKLIHADDLIYNLFLETEIYFIEAIDKKKFDILDYVVEKMLVNYYFDFPCNEHKVDVLSQCLFYYVTMRMRQFVKVENRKPKSQNKLRKKQSRLATR